MLRYQLNPHFLFNTLNAISTLVLDGQGKVANQAVTRLSEFLRYTLDQDPMKNVTLRQELDALNLYLGIEKLRFGDRLKLEFEVDDARCSGARAVAAPAAAGRERDQVRDRAARGGRAAAHRCAGATAASSGSSSGRRSGPAGGRRPRRGPRRRPPQHARAACRAVRRAPALAVRFARPGLRVEIALPFERAVEP